MKSASVTRIVKRRRLPLEEAALFLDLDGTLAPIRRRPSDVRPDPWRTALLKRAATRLDGRLAVISGRPIADVDRILEDAVTCVAGSHGLERRTASGAVYVVAPHSELGAAGAAFRAFAAANGGLPVEHKPLSIALHYREKPQAAEAALALAERLADYTGLTLQRGKMVVELKTPGPDKAAAVHAFLREPPFRGATPVVIGDDLTDEPAFAVAAEAGGEGVLVGGARPSAATVRLAGVPQVLDWIQCGLAAGVFTITAAR